MSELNFGVNDIGMIADVVRSHSGELKEIDEFCGKVSDWTFKCSDQLDVMDARMSILEHKIDEMSDDSGVTGTICSMLVLAGIGYAGYRLYKALKKEKESVSDDFFEEIKPQNVSEKIQNFDDLK